MRLSKAYTLIELVMVIVLLSILAAVGFVNISSYRSQNVRAAAERVASDLRYAKDLALSSTKWHGASFSISPTNTYTLYQTDGTTDATVKNPQNMANDYTITMASEYPGVAISAVNIASGSKVEFSPLGVPYNDKNGSAIAAAGTITLSGGSSSVNISIESQTGRISIQ